METLSRLVVDVRSSSINRFIYLYVLRNCANFRVYYHYFHLVQMHRILQNRKLPTIAPFICSAEFLCDFQNCSKQLKAGRGILPFYLVIDPTSVKIRIENCRPDKKATLILQHKYRISVDWAIPFTPVTLNIHDHFFFNSPLTWFCHWISKTDYCKNAAYPRTIYCVE